MSASDPRSPKVLFIWPHGPKKNYTYWSKHLLPEKRIINSKVVSQPHQSTVYCTENNYFLSLLLLFTIDFQPDKRRRSFALIVIKYPEDNTKLFTKYLPPSSRFMNSFVEYEILDFHGE